MAERLLQNHHAREDAQNLARIADIVFCDIDVYLAALPLQKFPNIACGDHAIQRFDMIEVIEEF
jgi:hypothetical protein